MTSFLQAVFQRESSRPPADIYIFPTKRAVQAFKKEYINASPGSKELPVITAWAQWIEELTPLTLINRDLGRLLLYHVYCEHFEKVDYKEFLNWGQTVYDDFELVSLQGEDGEKLFSASQLLKNLEQWGVNSEEKSPFIQLWEKLPKLYSAFYNELSQRGFQTNSTKYKNASTGNFEGKRIVLVGFTLFSPEELKLLKAVENEGSLTVYYDSPQFSGVGEAHEANLFEGDLTAILNDVIVLPSHRGKKSIISYACSQNTVGIKQCADLLTQLSPVEQDRSCVVLLNDSDLQPLLNSLPENISALNTGIGKPYSITEEGELMICSLKIFKEIKSSGRVSVANILELISLRAFDSLFTTATRSELRKGAIGRKLPHLNKQELNSLFRETPLSFLLEIVLQSDSLLSFMKRLLASSLYSWSYSNALIKKLNKSLNLFSESLSEDEVDHLFTNLINAERITLKGDKQRGLQILSLLETRCLDFDRIIFVGVQEERLSVQHRPTYLPQEVIRQYRLPHTDHREAILAYHFLRLIKRSGQIDFIYTQGADGMSLEEPSRFVLQAQIEWSRSEDISFQQFTVSGSGKTDRNIGFQLPKTADLVTQIQHYLFENGLSPSALNVYLANPMDFFLFHILGLHEKEEVDLSVEPSTLGTVVHNVLELIYQPSVKHNLSVVPFAEWKQKIDSLVVDELKEVYPAELLESGRFKILKQILSKWLIDFLDFDERRSRPGSIQILDLERRCKSKISNDRFPIALKGTVDRVEVEDNVLHIIDYKTGKVDKTDLKLSIDELENFSLTKSKAYQLLLYGLMYKRSFGEFDQVKCSIYSFRNRKSGLISLSIDEEELFNETHFSLFEKGLAQMASEILDENVPVELTKHRYQKFEI